MYNRYIPNGTSYTRISQDDGPVRPHQAQSSPSRPTSIAGGSPRQGQSSPLSNLLGGLGSDNGLLGGLGNSAQHLLGALGGSSGGLLKSLKLDQLDTGDILLLLILLLVLLEGDDLELVITLGLLLLLGLGGDEEDGQPT